MENPIKEYSLKHLNDKEKENIIERYLQEVKPCKKILCHPWFRGFCSFSKIECKYAHGISELEYEKVSQRKFEARKEHISESEIFNLKYEFRNYKILEEYIMRLKSSNTLNKDEDFSLNELNSDGKIRTKIRERFHKEITLEFMNFLFNQYPNIFLSVNFLTKEFELIKYPLKFNWVFNSDDYFISDIPVPPRIKNSFKAVFAFPDSNELEKNIKEFVSNIISDLQKENKGETTEKQITTEYYKNKPFNLPPLHVLLKKINKDIDEFMKDFLKFNEEEKTCFISTKEQKNKFVSEIEICLNEYWSQKPRKKFGFGKYSDLINYVNNNNFQNLAKDIFKTNSQFIAFLHQYLIKNQMILIFLFSETFIINLNLLRKQTEDDFLENLTLKNIKSTKCEKNHLDWKDDYLNEIKFKNEERNEQKFASLDEKRIVVVDELTTFLYAKEILSNSKKIGVDIEGKLCEGGSIDLIQMGVKNKTSRKIFIFDIHSLKNSKENEQIFSEIKLFLKGLLQNNKIIKVFHDCRKDSLALHLFLDNTCPVKVVDTSCIHILIEQIRLYKDCIERKFDEYQINDCIYKMQMLLWPGLNVVLNNYKASNGINSLKEKMKKKFNNEPREYFLKRPINEEFLEYSAKDVEDLVEVFENQEKVVEELFYELDVGIKEIFVKDYLLEKISYYYVKEGCITSFD